MTQTPSLDGNSTIIAVLQQSNPIKDLEMSVKSTNIQRMTLE